MRVDDDFQNVAGLVDGSRLGRIVEYLAGSLRVAASRSVVSAALRRLATSVLAIDLAERIRLLGVLILIATITQGVLVQASLPMIRPAAPAPLRFELAAFALLMIVLARPIARASGGSRFNRLFRRATMPHSDSPGAADRT